MRRDPKATREELSYREHRGRRLSVVKLFVEGMPAVLFEVHVNGDIVPHAFESTHAAEAYRSGFIEGFEEAKRPAYTRGAK